MAQSGVKLYQSTTDVQLSTISATDAYAVDLADNRLVYSDDGVGGSRCIGSSKCDWMDRVQAGSEIGY